MGKDGKEGRGEGGGDRCKENRVQGGGVSQWSQSWPRAVRVYLQAPNSQSLRDPGGHLSEGVSAQDFGKRGEEEEEAEVC